MRPADAEQEKKYLRVGAAVGALLVTVLVLLLISISCTCGGCSGCGGGDESFVNSNVEGEWSAVEGVSSGDAVSQTDAPTE